MLWRAAALSIKQLSWPEAPSLQFCGSLHGMDPSSPDMSLASCLAAHYRIATVKVSAVLWWEQ